MGVLRKMTGSHICKSIIARKGEIGLVTNDLRITQIREDPISLTTHLKSQPVKWNHISENLDMTVAAVKRQPSSGQQHPLNYRGNPYFATISFPRLMMIEVFPMRKRIYVLEVSRS